MGHFLKNWDTTIPALIGLVLLLRQAKEPQKRDDCRVGGLQSDGIDRGTGEIRNSHLLPPAWLGLTLLVFTTHQPWWSYYYIHLSIALCWCAALGIQTVWRYCHQQRRAGFALLFGLFGICALGWTGARIYFQVRDIRSSPQIHSALVLKQIQRLKPFTRFMYTD